ncbi:hypothetical protein WA026_018584 [Henosepilachna vigintioctopunctata]|uniref:Transmembrane protein 209 n=1 Tax=Henosepilachna vigintioctopunctata TaxID=420089 RepID=A0AAW1UBP4_9CUCU
MDLSVTPNSPRRCVLKGSNSPALERSLMLKQNRHSIKSAIIWTTVNVAILSLLLYDVSYTCPSKISYYEYMEYALILLICLNILYHITKIIIISIRFEQIPITLQQKKLLGVRDYDSSYKIVSNLSTPNESKSPSTPMHLSSLNTTLSSKFSSTPMNSAANSWLSSSPNESLSTSWTYQRGSPTTRGSSQVSPKQPSYLTSKLLSESFKIDPITDESSLDEFLKEKDTFEKINRVHGQSPQSSNLLSSFWRHPVTKNPKDSLVLSKCKYQLSPLSRDNNGPGTSKTEENITLSSKTGLEPWTRINVDIVALTQWNENFRKWISQTILERLVHEIDSLNASLEKHGLNDLRIGSIGLDRLRKTAHVLPAAGHLVPSMKTLIQFMEVTPNQEYLTKRIRQLAKGGCMSNFRWNGGDSHDGKPWNDSLPTDCAIIMHLLATYLDTQLMPLPSAPDVKPFSGYHYIKCNDKIPPLDGTSIFIHQVSERPPHYRIIVGDRIYEMGKGYNNMFHSILFFLYHINKIGQGMIGRVNLGRAGVNMLWIIDQ